MSRASAFVFSCSRASKPILIVREFLCRAVIHLLSAIVAEQESRKHTDLAFSCGSALVFSKFPDKSKSFAVDDGRVSVLKDFPLFFGTHDFFLAFERFLCRAKIDGIAYVFLFFQNIRYTSLNPSSTNRRQLATLDPLNCPMLAWRRNLFFCQYIGDLRRTISFNTKRENPSNNFCGRLINDPLLGILEIFQIAIRRRGCQWNTRFTLMAKDLPHLLRSVLRVHFVEPILHRQKVAESLCGIDVIQDCDIPNAKPIKFFFQKLTDHKTVASKSRVIFYDERFDLPLLGKLHDLRKCRACKIRSRIAVIDEKAYVFESVFFCVFFKY